MAILVLHRAGFSPEKRTILEEAGITIITSRSVGETLASVERTQGMCVIAVSLSVGSQAPEQVVAGVRRLTAGGRSDLHLVPTSPVGRNNNQRARNLKLDLVYVWPDGAFHQIATLLASAPSVVMRRFSERAAFEQEIGTGDELGLDARIVNISTSGAMLDCAAAGAKLEGIGFEFSVAGTAPVPIYGRVVWREAYGQRTRLGLQFVGVSDATRAAIDAFVRGTNVIQVAKAGASNSKGQAPGSTVCVARGTRRDYFHLDVDDDNAVMTLVPKAPFFVPYEIGDEVDVRRVGAPAVQARIVARRPVDPDRIDSRIAWQIEAVLPDASKATTVVPVVVDDMSITSPIVMPTMAVVRDLRWSSLARFADALALGEDPFAGATHVVVLPPSAGSTQTFSARTFMMAIAGRGTTLVFREADRALLLPPAGDEALALDIGRDASSAIVVDNSTVSKQHARLIWRPALNAWEIVDLGSSNGTRIREDSFAEVEEVVERGAPRSIKPSNIVSVGKQRLHVVDVPALRAICLDLLSKRSRS